MPKVKDSWKSSVLIRQTGVLFLKRRFWVGRFFGRSFIFFDEDLSLSQVIISALALCDDHEKSMLDAYLEGSAIE